MTDRDPLHALWASDQGEKFTMSIAELTARSETFRTRILWRNLIEYCAALLVIGIFGWMIYVIPVWSVKIGAGLIIAAALYISWRLNKIASTLEEENGMSAEHLIHYHQRALIRQRDALRSVWRWYLLPFVPGLVVFILGVTFAVPTEAPFWALALTALINLSFCAAIFGAVWALNVFAARKLDIEIQALESLSLSDAEEEVGTA